MTAKTSEGIERRSRTLAALLALLAALLVLPLALAPRAEAFIYWTTGARRGTVARANLDGTGVNEGFIARGGGRSCCNPSP